MHWFLDPIKHQYVDFSGRATRQQYWMFTLFNIIISIGVTIVGGVLGLDGLLSSAFSLAVLLPSIAIGARRLHDIDKSGWWLLVAFIPLIGVFVLLYWFIKETGKEVNQYGEPAGGHVTTPDLEAVPQIPEAEPLQEENRM
jgi:uncharacterized membrane protein YhaH (DUF805 family)